MEPNSSYLPGNGQKFPTWLTVAIAVVGLALVALLLNYFGVLSLGFLPQQNGKTQTSTAVQPKVDNSSFTPSLNPESQMGTLVKSATVVYTLQGKITKVTPNDSNYNLEITSLDGAQIYNAVSVGGEGILRGAKSGGELEWSALSPGDDVLVNVSVSKDSSGKETVSIGQILVNNK